MCNLGAELVRCNWNAAVVFPQSASQEGLAAWCQAENVPCLFAPPRFDINQTRTLTEMRFLSALVRRYRPDILHFHYPSSYISLKDVLAARFGGAVCTSSIHGISNWKHGPHIDKLSTRAASRLCRAVTANGQATAQALRFAGVKRNIHLIGGGVPLPLTLPAKAEARKRLGLPSDGFIVAAAGRLVRQKRIAEVLQAAAAVRASGRPLQVIVAGDGPRRGPLTDLARTLDVPTRFFGHLSRMDDFYASAEVFALPSEKESFGLVYVEAGLHGLPSIGAHGGGVDEVIENGVTGFLVRLDTPSEIADALIQLYDSPAKRRVMGDAARHRAQTRFSVQQMTSAFADLYQQIAPAPWGARKQISAGI